MMGNKNKSFTNGSIFLQERDQSDNKTFVFVFLHEGSSYTSSHSR